MPATRGSKRPKRRRKPSGSRRPGLPRPASVIGTATLISPKGNIYRVLQTDERDPYDPPDQPAKKTRRRKPG